ncbi:MAG: MBL fold metallo-hydrolase [Maritimibacter sp.]
MTPLFARSSLITAFERLLVRGGALKRLTLHVRYGLVRHPKDGPILIDTGYTEAALRAPGRGAFLWIYSKLFRAKLLPLSQPEAFLARHGLAPSDIKTIIITHFHADHVSGLHLFPSARILLHGPAFERLKSASALVNLRRGTFSELIPADAASRAVDVTQMPRVALENGLDEGWDLFGDSSAIGVDLPGHADGHFGLLFPNLSPPLLYACDAQWLIKALELGCAPRFPANLVATNPRAAALSERRIAAFRAGGGTVMTCHDPNPAPFDEDVP